MQDVNEFFREQQEIFTIYVVEQRFAVGRGLEYFKSFRNTPNFIDSNKKAQLRISLILKWIQKKIPDTAELIDKCFSLKTPMGLVDIIVALNKLFSTNEHQAVGPDVIDPIILQEGEVLPKYLYQIISLHKESILQPTIIILLKDNDFDRAKKLLATCPHGINVKMIRNSGESIIYKIVNVGANSPNEFLDAFARQCFSTCSHTKRDIIVNEDWAEDSIVKKYCPELLQIRTNLICDEKDIVSDSLNKIILSLDKEIGETNVETTLIKSLLCISKIFRTCCNDCGNKDIYDAYKIAKDLNSEILLAQVYRYSFFMDFIKEKERLEFLDVAYNIFSKNNMEDNAIYCKNNRIIRQFDTDKISMQSFTELQGEAIYNVPGLVGMSHILNNVGVAHLMTGNPEEAIICFDKGLDYAKRPERTVQKIALLCNKMIANAYCFETIDIKDLKFIMNLVIDNMGTEKLPFIAARYAMNIISIAFHSSTEMGKELLDNYNLVPLIQKAFDSNIIGSGQLALQMQYLDKNFLQYNLLDSCQIPKNLFEVTGKRREYIEKHGFNPFFFSTWL